MNYISRHILHKQLDKIAKFKHFRTFDKTKYFFIIVFAKKMSIYLLKKSSSSIKKIIIVLIF